MKTNFDKNALLTCHQAIQPFIHRTPVLTSFLINKRAGAKCYFKCENFQRSGAYKIRGAMHAILKLTDGERQNGVVTHSSGNFAQALSLAAKILKTQAHIIMPNTAPQVKKEAVLAYGGQITQCEPTLAAREAAANKTAIQTGASFIHPSNNENVIIGQGSAALELLENNCDLDYILVPVGGGGLVAGTCLAVNSFAENCRVVGAEPYAVDDAYRSLKSGKIESNESTNTIADGLKTQLGDKSFPIIQQYIDRIIRVSEPEICTAMRLIWERMKLVVEASSAVALAAVLSEPELFAGKKVGIIISGGNVDLRALPF